VASADALRARSVIADGQLEDLGRPEKNGKWSMAQVLRHLCDSELIWGYRLRRVLAEDRPPILRFSSISLIRIFRVSRPESQ